MKASTQLLRVGPPPSAARAVLVLVHGRGGSAGDILGLVSEIGLEDLAYLAPQVPGNTWYPHSFLVPIEQNEPSLSASLATLDDIVAELEAQKIRRERIGLLGFSQGGCLSLEFAARNAQRYAAVLALSAGLIGPPGTPRDYSGSFDGTPVFLGCSDVDPHIPVERVHESAAVFRRMGASVDERIYPAMGHTVNRDELAAVAAILGAI